MTKPADGPTIQHHTKTHRTQRMVAVTGILVTIALSVLLTQVHEASADAGFASGRSDVTTNGFTHPWLGGYVTDVGTAWCIESGQAYPRAVGNTPAEDLPAARGVSATDRNALAYAVWAHTATADPTTAAGLATVAHGLSGDDAASVDVPSMQVSDPVVKAAAVNIYNEAESRAFWVSDPEVNPWKITIVLTHVEGNDWNATTSITTADGQPVAFHRVGLVPYNVTDAPATEHVYTTDASGQIHTSWTQADPSRAITLDAQTTAPRYYSVWTGPDYPLGSIPQRIITSNGTIYRGHARQGLPSGKIRVHKTTTNPDYQSATGATFDVIAKGDATSLGTLTVGSDGSSNVLELPIGDYVVTETSAPAGVVVDTSPYPVVVTEGTTATVSLADPVVSQAALALNKVDSITGEPVAGARLLVERDSNADGTYDETIGTFTSALTPTAIDSMTAGNFRITEVAAPSGYELPAETVQEVSIDWDQTATVTFEDHRSIAVTTQTHLVDDGGELPVVPDGLENAAHVVAPIGPGIGDTVSVDGVADGEPATVTVALYGPSAPQEAPVCDAAHRVFTDSWQITGSGDSRSESFTPETAGRYTWIATLEVGGLEPVSGPCGELSESAIFTPTISTVAQSPAPAPDEPATDEITVTGLASGTQATVRSDLYGPFGSSGELADACTAGNLGDPVGTVTDPISVNSSPMVLTSSPITVPEDDAGGWYTFIGTLEVPGYPPITHECGIPAETFHVAAPTTTTTTSTTTTIPPTTTPPTTSTTTSAPPATSTTVPPATTPATTTPPPATTTTPAPTTASTTTSTTTLPPPTTTTTLPPSRSLPPATTTPPATTIPPTTSTTTPATTTTPPDSTTTTTSSTTTSTTTMPPATTTSTLAPPATTSAPGPVSGQGTGGGSSAELPRTGAVLDRLLGVGAALVMLGAAALLLVARSRIHPEG